MTEVAKLCKPAMKTVKNWYVVYSKPRWEKKISRLLAAQALTVYCPLNKIKKRWSDRIKTVEVPLFTSYVFVYIDEKEKLAVRETPGVINFIYAEGKPAIVKEKEIERIKRFLNEYENVEVLPEIAKDQKVKISQGLFIEKEGKVLDVQNNKVRVVIESLDCTLIAVFDRSELAAV